MEHSFDSRVLLTHYSIVYATACLITYVWVVAYVPETRGVPLGKPMDELFVSPTDKISGLEDGEVEEIEDIDEHTALLSRQRERERRRSSFAGLH